MLYKPKKLSGNELLMGASYLEDVVVKDFWQWANKTSTSNGLN
jgi:hypothetical protein